MKKLVIILMLLIGLVSFVAPHVHDENCGYDVETKQGCVYESIKPLAEKEPEI